MILKTLKILGLVVIVTLGLFLIWYKFIYTEFDEFKNATFLEHRKYISTDGPYVLYEKDSMRIIQVVENSDDYIITDKCISKADTTNELQVNSFSYDEPSKISFKLDLFDYLPIAKSVYPKVDKLFVVSDIEGNLYAFHKLLKANKVIDDKCNWSFGDGHLVLVGDFMDRGANVTQCLWLIYKLENQARQHGGCVHFILGNHDLYDLKGLIIQVRTKYKRLANKVHLRYSEDLYGTNSELGRWLRTKNAIEKIGNLLFVHAGITQNLIDLNLPIEEMNQIVRNDIGLPNYTDSVSRKVHEGTLNNRVMGHDIDENTHHVIQNAKDYFGVETIIIGHSTVSDIYQQFNGALINVDVHFPHRDSDEFRGKALLIEFGKRYKVDDLGNKKII